MVVNAGVVLALSLLVGIARKGTISNLISIKVRYPWVVVGAFFIQYAAIFVMPNHTRLVDIVSYAIIVFFALVNRRNSGILIVLIGVLMNYSIMLVNGGRMPVYLPDAKLVASPAAIQSLVSGTYGKQIVMSSHTHLNFLGDIFYLGHPFPNPTLLSAGDILVAIGVFLFVQLGMTKPKMASQGDTDLEV